VKHFQPNWQRCARIICDAEQQELSTPKITR